MLKVYLVPEKLLPAFKEHTAEMDIDRASIEQGIKEEEEDADDTVIEQGE